MRWWRWASGCMPCRRSPRRRWSPSARSAAISSRCARIWSGVRWPRLWPFLVGGLIGVPIGTALLEHRAGAAAEARRRHPADLLLRLDGPGAPSADRERRRPRWPMPRPASAAACWAAWRASAARCRSIWVQLRGWTKHGQRGVNQPYNMSVLGTALALRRRRRLARSHLPGLGGDHLPVTLIGAQIGLHALRPHQRRAVPPARAGAARPVRPDADRRPCAGYSTLFRTARVPRAHDHEARGTCAVRKRNDAHEDR